MAELYWQSAAYRSHGILIPLRFSQSRPHCLIRRPRGAVTGRKYHYPHTFHCHFGKLFQISKRHICRSLFQCLGVWLLWLTIFKTARVINVPVKLLFCFQDSAREKLFKTFFLSPSTFFWQRNNKTTGIYFSFFIIFSIFAKILFAFSFIVC